MESLKQSWNFWNNMWAEQFRYFKISINVKNLCLFELATRRECEHHALLKLRNTELERRSQTTSLSSSAFSRICIHGLDLVLT